VQSNRVSVKRYRERMKQVGYQHIAAYLPPEAAAVLDREIAACSCGGYRCANCYPLAVVLTRILLDYEKYLTPKKRARKAGARETGCKSGSRRTNGG